MRLRNMISYLLVSLIGFPMFADCDDRKYSLDLEFDTKAIAEKRASYAKNIQFLGREGTTEYFELDVINTSELTICYVNTDGYYQEGIRYAVDPITGFDTVQHAFSSWSEAYPEVYPPNFRQHVFPNLDWSQAQSLNVIRPGAKARVKVALDLSYLQANKNNPVIAEDLADRMSWDRLLGSVIIYAFECDEQLISKPTRKGIEAAW